MLSIFTEKEIKQIHYCVCEAKDNYECRLNTIKKEKTHWSELDMLSDYYESMDFIEEQLYILSNIVNKMTDYMKDNNIK